jgi:hypothetical protein
MYAKKQPIRARTTAVYEPSASRCFYRNPPPRASDGRAVVSRKDDGGSCSQALQPSLAPLHARSTANVNPVRRSELGAFAREYGAKKHERATSRDLHGATGAQARAAVARSESARKDE